MAASEYTRLTRSTNRNRFGVLTVQRSSLWLGKDHVLLVENSGYTETYKRFYFQDIQSIQARRTDHWKIFGAIHGTGLLLFGALAILPQDVVTAWIFGPIAILFLVLFVVNLALGPTCRTIFQTAVQTERLPSLERWRKTNKVLDRLRVLIAQAQGELAPQDLAARLAMLRGTPVTRAPVPSSAASLNVPPPADSPAP